MCIVFVLMSFSDKVNSTTGLASEPTATVRSKLLFAVQVSAILLVICCSLINLSVSHYFPYIDKKDDKLWIVLLSSTIGYLLPNPKLKTGLKAAV